MRLPLRSLVLTTAFAGVVLATALIACTDTAPLTPPTTPTPRGCSGSNCDGGTGTSSGELTIEGVCTEEAAAYCDEIVRCFPDSPVAKDAASCVDSRKRKCNGWLAAPGTSRTLEGTSDCARDRRTIECEKVYSGGVPDTCKVLPGPLANGRVCTDDGQCSGRLCRAAGTDGCGVCTTLPGAGEDCSQVYACESGLLCDMKVCVAPGKAGASCATVDSCATNLRCVGGVCATPIPLGGTCVPNGDDNPCAKGYCSDATRTCAEYAISTPGGPCAGAEKMQCPANYGCAVADGQTTGTCVKISAAPGESCVDGQATLACTGGAKCVSGVCTITSTENPCQ